MVIVNLEGLCATFCFITLCDFYHLNTNSAKGEGEGEGEGEEGGGVRVKIPRDKLTMWCWLPFHSGLAQKRTKMGSIIGHNIG